MMIGMQHAIRGSRRIFQRRANATAVARFHTSSPALANVLLSDPIEQVCIDKLEAAGHSVTLDPSLAKNKEEMLKVIGKYEGLIVRSGTKVTADIIEKADNMKFIGRAGTGVDNIDLKAATKKGIIVVNTPGGNTISAAELTMSMLFAVCRNIPAACDSLKQGRWDRKSYTGVELNGKTIGVIGLGRIGREVAKWCQAFGMETIGFDPVMSAELASQAGITPVPLKKLFANADFITLHCPLTPETANLIDDSSLAQCKEGVRIINCARGGIIDEEALLRALESGKVHGVGLDVYEEEPPPEKTKPLLEHPLVVCTPHLGASTDEAQEKVASEIAAQFVDAFNGKSVPGIVNAAFVNQMTPELRPYSLLAERMASTLGQIVGSHQLRKLTIRSQGPIMKGKEQAIKSAVLKGYLEHLLHGGVNIISAPMLAEDAGIRISEQREDHHNKFVNVLTVDVEVETPEGIQTKSISGTVFGSGAIRFVGMDGYDIEVDPEGPMLFWKNFDRPGVLAGITSLLSRHGVNIANFSLGRSGVGQVALGILNLDTPVDGDILSQLRQVTNIIDLNSVVLDEASSTSGARPPVRPMDPNFSSGPTKKRPGYDLGSLDQSLLGRSHRSAPGKARIQYAIEKSKEILGLPEGYELGFMPASDTGAFEAAMWSMLGERPVDLCYWESFGKGWMTDAKKQLNLDGLTVLEAGYGELPALNQTNSDHDIIFTWNGTTSGVVVPNGEWIADDRQGLTFCDATSAAFAMPMPWEKLDVTTYSWQKVLGGEAAHGVIILSPRAIERLESYKPDRPLPKIFRMTKDGKLDRAIFKGSVINTPSMICVEDYVDALQWAESVGGLNGLISRVQRNNEVVEKFVSSKPWINFLAQDPTIRSPTSVCLTLDLPANKVKEFCKLLETEGVAFDIEGYRDAPPSLRIWCGATVNSTDLEALMPWLQWAYDKVQEEE